MVDLSNQVILPFPAGCHVATFTATGMLLDFNDFEPADVYCFSTIDDEIVQINTSVVGRLVFNWGGSKAYLISCSLLQPKKRS